MKKTFFTVLCAAFLVFAISGSSSATLIGDTVTLEHNNGSSYGLYDVTVEASDVMPFYSYYTVDVLADSIVIDFTKATSFADKPFNGLILSGLNDSSGNVLSGVNSLYADTTFGDDWVAFNFANSSFALGDSITAKLSFGTVSSGSGETGANTMHNPIPAPILLLGTGLVGLAGFRRRIKK